MVSAIGRTNRSVAGVAQAVAPAESGAKKTQTAFSLYCLYSCHRHPYGGQKIQYGVVGKGSEGVHDEGSFQSRIVRLRVVFVRQR